MQARCPERPEMDMLGEGAEGGAGDARSAQDRQQGVLAAPEAARRDPGAIVRGILQSHR